MDVEVRKRRNHFRRERAGGCVKSEEQSSQNPSSASSALHPAAHTAFPRPGAGICPFIGTDPSVAAHRRISQRGSRSSSSAAAAEVAVPLIQLCLAPHPLPPDPRARPHAAFDGSFLMAAGFPCIVGCWRTPNTTHSMCVRAVTTPREVACSTQ